MPATALLGDVIMQAGGPGATANLEGVSIQRGGEIILEGNEIQLAFAEGRSVDQLNLRAGDQVVVPERSRFSLWQEVGRYALIIASSVLLGQRIF